MSFKFSLENMLDIKKRNLESKMQILAREIHEADECRKNISGLKKNREKCLKEAGADFCNRYFLDVYLRRITLEICEGERMLLEHDRKTAAARENVRDASLEHKKYEKLREKKLWEYTENLKRSDAREIDEIGISAFFRKAE